ncbi:hypothetical protein DPMN_145367 [Dreissena polymorpha]|uniref:Uncharacterized protein n=1 Tax=Dreissena polymorpha TaxID=45954 RepID=A0A9D4F894_DREPO|nr:hypothetical protein DPMN_145367 [Dreissena polymorpha]
MTQEDPDIQILLDHEKDSYCSLLADKTTQADDTYYAILIKFERATEKKKHELAQTSKTSIFGIGFHAGLGRDLEMQTPGTLSATFEHNSAMQDFTDLTYTTSPQHKDSIEACIKGDSSDLEKMQTQITTCSPYTADPTLRNMVN